jgi:hypothetical protein
MRRPILTGGLCNAHRVFRYARRQKKAGLLQATRRQRRQCSSAYSIAFTMSSTTFFASPKTIIVLSM